MLLVFGLLLSPLVEALPFVTTWNIYQANESIILPEFYTQSNVTIDWGDSSSDTANAGTVTRFNHTFALSGLHNVSIEGQFFWRFAFFDFATTKSNLVDIVSWGDGFLVNETYLFRGFSNLRVSAPANTQPVFLPGANLLGMFQFTQFNSSLDWDLANVTSLAYMFASTPLNKPITFRNTQGVTSISSMFSGAALFNQPFHFDASGLLDASGVFSRAYAFNQVVNLTNSSKLIHTSEMFAESSSFNQPLSLNTDSVIYMNWMFRNASSFASTVNFTSTANVTAMWRMFEGVNWFTQDLSGWDTQRVTECADFCPWCGLPSFPRCSLLPCSPTFIDDRNLSVCTNGTRSPTTAMPSRSPSTASPSAAPSTVAPSSAPSTAAPSAAPSVAPTSAPSSAPSVAPSAPSSTVSAAARIDLEFVAVTALVVVAIGV